MSAPAASAVSETHSRNGKVRRSRSAISAAWPGAGAAWVNPVANCGANSMPSAVTTSRTPPRVPAARAISAFRSAWVRVSLISVKTGTKAVENEPSANSRRMKFGMRNATQNASVIQFAPKVVLNTWSRTSPKTRLNSVIPPNDSTPRVMLRGLPPPAGPCPALTPAPPAGGRGS